MPVTDLCREVNEINQASPYDFYNKQHELVRFLMVTDFTP